MSQDETDPIGERIRAASQSVSAPLALREHLDRSQESRPRPYPSRLKLASIGAVLFVIATTAAIFAPGAPTVTAVAKAALQAPERDAGGDEVYLNGFTAVGARTDTVKGRTAKTVIYRRGQQGVHYTIVDGDPLDLPGSKEIATGTVKGASYVAAEVNGKTCVFASDTLDTKQLTALLKSI